MSIALAIALGLLAAFLLAAIALGLSFPAACSLVRQHPLTRRGILFRASLALAFVALHYYQQPQSLWLCVALVLCTFVMAALHWRLVVRAPNNALQRTEAGG